jgi:aminoglycoside phosphotransferase (APT) family kinase protein
MQYVRGRVFLAPDLPQLSRQERCAVYSEMNRVLAAIHSVDLDAAGLDDYGKKGIYNSCRVIFLPDRLGEYTKRNLLRWLKQYESSKTSNVAEIERLVEWLPKNVPSRVERCTLVHGDYRLDNCVFSVDSPPRLLAVLDWEISTIGDPLTDLATCLFAHYKGAEPAIMPGKLFVG